MNSVYAKKKKKKKKWSLIFKRSMDCHAFKDQDFFTDTKFFAQGNNDTTTAFPKHALSALEKKMKHPFPKKF